MITQPMTVDLHDISTLTVADGQWTWKAPYAGELLAVGGYIKTLGTGAGTSSDFQVRNQTQTKDMLSTVGAFEVDSATNVLEGMVVDSTNYSFAVGDIIDLDCDARASGNDAADAVVWLVVLLFISDV
ncbi:hypothetical protein LCGC14_2906300 [marine sediment metagenome]|uniref:Uncharacterized protein n=1 Tax=marine sediment metagenome TaxID=412755 RepID=A0A0F8XSX4_9ZZZZ